jgi:hypothetical protein
MFYCTMLWYTATTTICLEQSEQVRLTTSRASTPKILDIVIAVDFALSLRNLFSYIRGIFMVPTLLILQL